MEKTDNEIRLQAMLQEAVRQRDLCYSTGNDLIAMAGELAMLKARQPKPAEAQEDQQ